MTNRLKTLVALLLAVVMLLAIGCSGSKTDDSASKPAEGSKPVDTSNPATPAEEDGQHYVLRIGATDEAWRPEALIEATNRLNEQLAAEGCKDTVELEWEVVDDFKNAFPLWIQENDLPEIIAHKQTIIYKYAQSGHIVDAGYVVNDEAYSSKVPQNLRDFGLMDGVYYGIICDTETRFVTVYKPALIELGWTEDEIAAWRQDVIDGKFTAKDLQNLAKQIVDAGICEYGITHRPNSGSDWAFTFVTWNGGVVPQNEHGQNVISRQALIDCLTFFRTNVQMGLTPYNLLTDYNWDMLEGDIWPNGKSFCWYGNVATKSDCMSSGGVTSEYFDENYISIPNPVNKLGDVPACGCSPYMWALTSASQENEKVAEYCRRILDNVLDSDLQLKISLEHSHIAITDESAASDAYVADKWMSATTDLVPYFFRYTPSPLKDGLQDMYADTSEFFEAVQEAEVTANDANARSIEEIVDDFIAKVIFNMGEGNYVIVD